MFSFGTRHNQANSDYSPGPRYLIPSNITRAGRDGTPAFSLYSRPKEPGLFQFPGPGQKKKTLTITTDVVKAHENEILLIYPLKESHFCHRAIVKIPPLAFQANTPQSIQESWSSTLLLLFLFLGGAKKAAIAKHQVTYCIWCQFKIWITKFHGTKNINFTCNSYSRSSLLHSASCAGTQNCGNICSSHLLTLRQQQNWKLPWRPEEGTFYFIHSCESHFPTN